MVQQAKLRALRLLAVVLSVVMALAMCVGTAFADDVETTPQGSITINGAINGETYTAYKLFDVTTDGDGEQANAYAYSTTNEALTNSDLAIYFTFTEAASGDIWSVSAKDVSGAAIAEYISNHLAELGLVSSGSAVAANDTATISGLEAGYYFVDSSLGSLCALDTANATVTVDEKNSLPSIEKKVKEDSALAGQEWQDSATIDVIDTVYYQLTVNTGTGTSGLGNGVDDNYVITDVLPEGITYNDGTVAIADWTPDTDYTVVYAGDTRTLTITLYQDKLVELGQDADIVITYNAEAADNLAVDEEHANEVTLTYKSQKLKDTATVKTYDIEGDAQGNTFTKVDGTSQEPLAGVKFVLQNTAKGYATFDGHGYLTGWVEAQADATELTTDDGGHIYAYGLDADTYILTETETLPGYNLLNDTITVTIAEDGMVTYKLSSSEASAGQTITVENNSGTELPSTGGIGTTIFYIVGGVLVAGAVVLLVTKRRMNANK